MKKYTKEEALIIGQQPNGKILTVRVGCSIVDGYIDNVQTWNFGEVTHEL